MDKTTAIGLTIVIIIGMVIIIRLIVNKIVSGKLEQYVLLEDYEKLDKILDNFFCKITYTPFRREMLRLNGYSMQNNVGKVEQQFAFMFKNMRLTKEQEMLLAQRGFYYYMERKEYKKAEKMLKKISDIDSNYSSLKIMRLMFDILAKKETKYIEALKLSIENINNGEKNNKNIGIIEYLIALQYSYLKDTDNAKTYLNRAKIDCTGTEYEEEINQLLEQMNA